MSEWQPIETAPKDGTRVFTYRQGFGEAFGVAWFHSTWDQWYSNGNPWPDPTHWQPLPEPPA